ncbi:MAG TPA: methyltransferase [Nitrospira sp.]
MTVPVKTFDEFRDLLSEYRLPLVILCALELRLFTEMADRRWTMRDLARKLQVSERGLTILCRNLATAGLLHKKGEQYWNGRLAATFLNANHSAYRGDYLGLLMSQWRDWARLSESVRSGKPLNKHDPEDAEYRRSFTWAMHHRTVETAPKIAAQIPMREAKTLLDLGGGPGTYALGFLKKNPGLRATVCDRPAALEVAKEIASTDKAGGRLSYLPLDLLTQAIPGKYDVVWYSNVLHIYSPEQNRSLFDRIANAMNPGGRFIIQDAFLHDREGLVPRDASLFAVSMLLFTETGNTYSVMDVKGWLKGAGFESIRTRKMKKGMEDWEGGVLEATMPATSEQTPGRRRQSGRNSTGR